MVEPRAFKTHALYHMDQSELACFDGSYWLFKTPSGYFENYGCIDPWPDMRSAKAQPDKKKYPGLAMPNVSRL